MHTDAEVHFWKYDKSNTNLLIRNNKILAQQYLPEQLSQSLHRNGIQGCVAVTAENKEVESRFLSELAYTHPEILGVVGWTDLTAPAVADAAAGLRELPGGEFLCGIRHPLLAEPDPGWLAQPAVLRGLRALAAAGLAFDIVARPDQLPAAVTAAQSVPELAMVLDHLGGPPAGPGQDRDGPWATAIRRLAALPNMTCKLSGAHTIPARADDLRPYYQTVLAAFGPDRLMFGSDWPVSTLAAPYGQVCDLYRELTAQLSPAERDAIFDRTARRVYRLPAGGASPA